MRFALAVLLLCSAASAQTLKWDSPATGGQIEGTVIAKQTRDARPTIVYLKNLATERIGTEPDQSILKSHEYADEIVLVLDYAKHPNAKSPNLNADILKLRQDITDDKGKRILKDFKVDPNRLFIIPEGFRLRQDVEFARDGKRILAMDIIYPTNPSKPVPLLMEITCDNQNRMGGGSLLFCRDTLLEGGALAGFAVAMVDHPVAPPYKGIDDPMPQCLERMQSAVKTIRSLAPKLKLNGKIGAMGFSRGGPFAAMLACTGDVDAALIHGNRYDYLNLRADDPMFARFEKAWGPRDVNRYAWDIHGAAHYLGKDSSPMFLNTSDTESVEYREGLAHFSYLLKQAGREQVYQVDNDGRGHRVTTDPNTLKSIYGFFDKHLRD